MNEKFQSVKSSQVILKELMVPAYANFGGKVHGGIILSLMDKIAYTCAASHAKRYCVTASVDSVNFLNPVEVGELLTLYASVNYVGRSSMEVGIRVESEDFRQGVCKHTNTSYFSMVALDEATRAPVSVAGLVLQSENEIRRFIQGKYRKQAKRQHSEAFRKLRDTLDFTAESQKLAKENCMIKFPKD